MVVAMSGARSARRSPNELFSCGSCNERRANRRGGHRMSCFLAGVAAELPRDCREASASIRLAKTLSNLNKSNLS